MYQSEDNASSDSDLLFLSVQSAVSDRHAILEADGFSVMLYLTMPAAPKPVADCFVYSIVPPASELVMSCGKGGPPVLLRRFASEVALQPDIPASAHRLEFSPDGHSVAVLVRDEPWAFIARDEPRGYSRSISVAGPFGRPWNQQLYDDLFQFNRDA